jgi:protein-serine/threonine kinase
MLAPADPVPPLPSVMSNSLEHGGADSLETNSSGSSRGGRPTYQGRGNTLTTPRISNGMLEGPGKIAVRRTYSSNSIKVRQVRAPDRRIGGLVSLLTRRYRSR